MGLNGKIWTWGDLYMYVLMLQFIRFRGFIEGNDDGYFTAHNQTAHPFFFFSFVSNQRHSRTCRTSRMLVRIFTLVGLANDRLCLPLRYKSYREMYIHTTYVLAKVSNAKSGNVKGMIVIRDSIPLPRIIQRTRPCHWWIFCWSIPRALYIRTKSS
jgi:hypothetical protein